MNEETKILAEIVKTMAENQQLILGQLTSIRSRLETLERQGSFNRLIGGPHPVEAPFHPVEVSFQSGL